MPASVSEYAALTPPGSLASEQPHSDELLEPAGEDVGGNALRTVRRARGNGGGSGMMSRRTSTAHGSPSTSTAALMGIPTWELLSCGSPYVLRGAARWLCGRIATAITGPRKEHHAVLATSAGVNNASIHAALVDLLDKPIDECTALCIPIK
jgi:hypothetical protein